MAVAAIATGAAITGIGNVVTSITLELTEVGAVLVALTRYLYAVFAVSPSTPTAPCRGAQQHLLHALYLA